MTPSREAIEAAMDAFCDAFCEEEWRDGEAYWKHEVLQAIERARIAAYARDFPQPSKSDEERAKDVAQDCFGEHFAARWPIVLRSITAVRAEATLAEQERCAKVADAKADEWHRFHSLAGLAMEIAAAIRKGE